jgi:hypothetical protein
MVKTGSSARAGFAVVAVLLLLIGLTALAHAALVMATRERQASGLEARLILRRLVARTAATLPPLEDTLPTLDGDGEPLASGARGVLRWRTDATSLGSELVLLTGSAALDHLPGEARTGALAWRIDPSLRAAAAAAVVEFGGGAQVDGVVTVSGWLEPERSGGMPGELVCAPELHVLDSLAAGVPTALAVLPAAGPALPGLGMLPGDTLLGRSPLTFVGEITPTPVVDWRTCPASETNWGSPSEPGGPCGGRFVHVGAPGDLTLRGGEGQGVLVVRGSLLIAAGARFDGLVLGGGDLIVEDGRLVGAARVAGSVTVGAHGRIDGSACAVARALRALPTLRAPMLLPEGRIHPL